MTSVGFIMRAYSYIFNGLLALFLLGISSLTWAGGLHNLKIGFLPWQSAALTYWLFGLSAAGLLILLLSLRGILRILFLVWNLALVVILVRGYVFSPFAFSSRTEMQTALWLTLGALLATVGAWFVYKGKPARA